MGSTRRTFRRLVMPPVTIGYLEFHIEQGPVLEALNLPLGVVDAIVGQSRYSLIFEGRANHAGTTPHGLAPGCAGRRRAMDRRSRTLCTAA